MRRPARAKRLDDHQMTSSEQQTASLASAYAPGQPTFVAGKGLYLIDKDGNRYLDAVAGTFNHTLGYGHPVVHREIARVLASGLMHLSSSFTNPTVEAAHAALVSIAPANLGLCHTKGSTGGSTAIEQAIRTAWAKTGRTSLMAFRNGHHGQTLATTEVSGMPFRRDRTKPIRLPMVHVEPPDCYRCPVGKKPETCNLNCLELIEKALDHPPGGENDFAAFVAEPILGAGGGITPPPGYWPELHERLKRRGVLLILDEIQTFGRTGKFFAAQHFGVDPDMIAVAKGISGIGVPAAGAVLMTKELAVLNSGERSLTWGSSVLTAAAITATIGVMKKPSFLPGVMKAAAVLAERLSRIQRKFSCIGTVRGVGLMTGLEIVKSKATREPNRSLTERILAAAMERRLILRSSLYGRGAFVKVRPSLIITPDEVDDLCDRLESSITAAQE